MTYIKRLVLQGFKSFNKKIAIPFPMGFSVVCGPNGSGKCIAGSSRIVLADGKVKTIKDVVENNIEKSNKLEKLDDGSCSYDNPENTEILSLNMESLKIEKKKISAFIKRKSPSFLMRIKTRTGKEIITTHYHPLFTIKNGDIMSAKAEELDKGVKIALPRILHISPENNSICTEDVIKSF